VKLRPEHEVAEPDGEDGHRDEGDKGDGTSG